ncbi:MAG: hypothetical protein AAF126_26270 [Chloroflexota bacterium]
MANIIEYGTFIIDITTAMINHRKQLTVDHLEGLEKIRVQAQELVTGCLQHESSDMTTLYCFLEGQATKPTKFIQGTCDFLLRFRIHPAYRDAVQQIKDCSLATEEELSNMKADLVAFMDKIGIDVPTERDVNIFLLEQERSMRGEIAFTPKRIPRKKKRRPAPQAPKATQKAQAKPRPKVKPLPKTPIEQPPVAPKPTPIQKLRPRRAL